VARAETARAAGEGATRVAARAQAATEAATGPVVARTERLDCGDKACGGDGDDSYGSSGGGSGDIGVGNRDGGFAGDGVGGGADGGEVEGTAARPLEMREVEVRRRG